MAAFNDLKHILKKMTAGTIKIINTFVRKKPQNAVKDVIINPIMTRQNKSGITNFKGTLKSLKTMKKGIRNPI